MGNARHVTRWTLADAPSQVGRTAIVTGSTSGVGFLIAKALADAGARVVVAARDADKGARAVAQIRAASPDSQASFELLDLGSLASITAFVRRIAEQTNSIDLLVNNAGLMMIPRRLATEDGFERQFGTNHLGHFALTALLWPMLRTSAAARVVTVSSLAHRAGRLNFGDINSVREYSAIRAYAQSKLANLVFAIELQRRIQAAELPAVSIAAHPGIARTNLFSTGQKTASANWWRSVRTGIGELIFRMIGSSAEQGHLPLVYAAVSPDAEGGGYYGPNAWGETRGWPSPARISRRALNLQDATHLWSLSEQLVGLRFEVGPGVADLVQPPG
jgi:NAD(P)-dependent dehydrogenase (short-subunit alcohol dehydrogenase family)